MARNILAGFSRAKCAGGSVIRISRRWRWPDWRLYREMRGKTSHSYDEAVALEVVAGIPKFLAEASHLSEQLQKRMA